MSFTPHERERLLKRHREANEARSPKYEHLEARMLTRIPEIRQEYEFAYEGVEDKWPGIYLTVSDPICQLTTRLVEAPESGAVLARVFAFVEEMAVDSDEYITTMVAAGICEYMSGWDFLHRVWQYMGPSTRRIAHAMAVAWGHPLPEEYEQLDEAQRLQYRERRDEEKEKLGRSLTFDDPPRITRKLFAEFGIEPYFPIKDHGEA